MSAKVAFSPDEFRAFPLREVQKVSHDTKLFRVELPSPEHEMGMDTASCLLLQGASDDVVRPYTPTTLNSQKGYFDLVIKKYPDGKVSSYMHGLSEGDTIKVKGPIKKISIEPNMKRKIGMISGGTGITPMYQCILEILSNPEDKTELTLLYANKTEGDILMRKELDELAAKHSNFAVHYTVSEAEPGWTGGVGNISPEDIKTKLPQPSAEHLIFVCGPPGMMKAISGDKNPDKSQGELSGALKDAGYSADMVYKF